MKRAASRAVLAAAVLAALSMRCAQAAGAACPGDVAPRPDGVLLNVRYDDGRVVSYTAEQLRALGQQTWTERRSVGSSAASGAAAEEQAVSYDGVRLRDVAAAGARSDVERDHAMRGAVFEAVATDDYRAAFSWGELYNSGAGERTIVVLGLNGRPLDLREGPLALRALGDARPGPRHVRNLCALRVVRAPR